MAGVSAELSTFPTLEAKDLAREAVIRDLQKKVDTLTFEGGGMKAVTLVGVLRALEEMGILPNIKTVAGTSAGAIAATLLALNVPLADIQKELEVDLSLFLSDPNDTVLAKVWRFIRYFGVNTTDTKERWFSYLIAKYASDAAQIRSITELIQKKCGDKAEFNFANFQKLSPSQIDAFSDVDFGQLRERKDRNGNSFKDLSILVTQLAGEHACVCNAKLTERMKVRDALNASTTIPFVFKPVFGTIIPHPFKKDADGRPLGAGFTLDPNGEPILDGGLAAAGNNPAEVLSCIDMETGDVLEGEALKAHQCNFVPRLLSIVFVPNRKPTGSVLFKRWVTQPIFTLFGLVKAQINSLSQCANQPPDAISKRIIYVELPGEVNTIGPLDDSTKQDMIKFGERAFEKFIDRCVQDYKENTEAIVGRKLAISEFFSKLVKADKWALHSKKDALSEEPVGFQLKANNVTVEEVQAVLNEAALISSFSKPKFFSSKNSEAVIDFDVRDDYEPKAKDMQAAVKQQSDLKALKRSASQISFVDKVATQRFIRRAR